jgi:chlorite dismutase
MSYCVHPHSGILVGQSEGKDFLECVGEKEKYVTVYPTKREYDNGY